MSQANVSGSNLKQARKAAKTPMMTIAQHIGVYPATVYAWERGKIPPIIRKAIALAKLYGRTVEELFDEPPAEQAAS